MFFRSFTRCWPSIAVVMLPITLWNQVLMAEISPLVLVEKGQAQAVIVIPKVAVPAERYAAEELQYHLRRATDVVLPILSEGEAIPAGKAVVYLGHTRRAEAADLPIHQLQDNSFLIHRAGNDLLLIGRDSDGEPLGGYVNRTRVGTLFAVYEFLETHLAVRWLWPGELGERIPRTERVVVEGDLQKRGDYPYAWTHLRVSPGVGQNGWGNLANRDRFLRDQEVFLRRHRFSQLRNLRASHSFEKYWQQYGQSHPEYFALSPDGRRAPLADDSTGIRITMCVSQPALWDQIVEGWKARGGHQRESSFIPMGENDAPGMCTCPDCRAWDAPHPGFESSDYWSGRAQLPLELSDRFGPSSYALGFRGPDAPSLSNRYARFYRAVQQRAELEGGSVWVGGFAYANYSPPPVQTRLNRRVVISLVPGMGEGFYFPFTKDKRKQFRRQWRGWAATGASLLLRPNYTLSGHNFPIFYARQIAEDFQFAARNGLIGTDFDSLVGSWATQGPTLYTLARMHTRPDWPVERYLDEYYSIFGPAEPAVRAYFAHWEQVSDQVTEERMAQIQAITGHQSHRFWYQLAPHIFSPAIMARGRELMASAQQAAADDSLACQRVAFLEKGLRHAELTLATELAFQAYQRSPSTATLEGYRKAMRDLEQFRHTHEGDGINHMGYLTANEGRVWDRSLSKLDALGDVLPAAWKIQWDPDQQGAERRWFDPEHDDHLWLEVGVDSHWRHQPAGKAFHQAHGADYEGVAWYRNRFNVAPGERGRQVLLVFGAVDAACTVYLNGKVLTERSFPHEGSRQSWADPFEVDITDAVRWDQPNVLAVRVDSVQGQGGIWKPVRLITRRRALAQAPENLVLQPSFEPQESEAGWAWRYLPDDGESSFKIERMDALFGRHAALITLQQASGRLVQSVAGVQVGRTYTMRFHVRTSPEFTGRVTASVEGAKTSTSNTGGQWRELSLEVPATRDRIYLALWCHQATGRVWIDGVEVLSSPPAAIATGR